MLVATGELSTSQAVPAIMGANIGTSITNILVSLAHWRSRHEFRVAFSAAVVHDIFNFLTVAIMLPLELMFGLLSKIATWSAHFFNLPEDMEMGKGFVKTITEPVIHWISEFLGSSLGMTSNAVGLTLAALGVVMLFVALIMLVKMLKGLMLGRLESLFRRFFFSNTATAMIVGLVVTVMVQSSSVTTSLIIPFVGAGLLTLRQVFPYMVGANIGTTCTGLIAAAAANTGNALIVAFVHLIFNLLGAVIFIPLREVPINLSKRLSKIVARRRWFAVLYVVGIFLILPIVCMYVFSWWSG
jgi:sodium-dependent phosphate cotransporter